MNITNRRIALNWRPKIDAKFSANPRVVKISAAIIGLFFLLYLALGALALSQAKALISSAKTVSHERHNIGTAQFTRDYVNFSEELNSFSSTSGNPLFAPLFAIVGSPATFTHARAISRMASEISHNLIPAISSIKHQKTSSNGFNLDVISQAAPYLEKSQTQINSLLTNLSQLHFHGLLAPFDSKLHDLRTQAKSALVISRRVIPLLSQAPSLLGSEETRRYLIAFQNPAEARGTGGIIGAYAIVSAKNARLQIEHVGSNSELVSADYLPIQMPKDFHSLYGEDPAIWQNSNMSPHFPNAAKIWMALWQRQHGQLLDGVIALDPFVLQQYLSASGPLKVGSQSITADNLIDQTLSHEYFRYVTNNDARKQFLVDLLKASLDRLTHTTISIKDFLTVAETPLADNRIFLYSSHQNDQDAIEKSTLSGTLSTAPDNSFRLVVNNLAGNKMEYYLNRAITITSISCGKKPITQVDYTVENTVNPLEKLPAYVNGRLDLGKPNGFGNSTKIEAFLYGPTGSTLIGALNVTTNKPDGEQARENNHPILINTLEMKPRALLHITARFQGGVGPITHITQPLVRPETVIITDKCHS